MTLSATLRRAALGFAILAILVLGALAAPACGPGDARTKTAEEQAEFHYKLANNFFYDQNPQSALEELFRVLQIAPKHRDAHYLLGFIYFGRKDYARAQEHLAVSLEVDPDFDEAQNLMGSLYLENSKWAAALPYFYALLDKPLYPTPYLAHNNAGWALFHLGHYEQARKHYEKAIFFKPEFCLGHNNLGRLHAHVGETRSAVERFEKATELCPAYLEPHYFLARIYRALGQLERAATHFERCRKLGPETPYGRACRDALPALRAPNSAGATLGPGARGAR